MFREFPYSNDVFNHESHYITLFFIGEIKSGGLRNMEPDKCAGWEWHDYNKIPEPRFRPLDQMVNNKVLEQFFKNK